MSSEEQKFVVTTYPASGDFKASADAVVEAFRRSPIPPTELVDQLTLYASPSAIRRLIHFDRLYQMVVDIPGSLMLLGVRWGRDLAALHALHQIYDPMNASRRFIGFDTFAGFPSVAPEDGRDETAVVGAYNVTESYEKHLDEVLSARQGSGTYGHMKRHELHKGDAPEQLRAYLAKHPETVVAFAYFDFDIYSPTKACAELLLPHLVRGSVLAFDEFVHPLYPGETIAAREVFGANAAFRRVPNVGPGHSSYLIFEG